MAVDLLDTEKWQKEMELLDTQIALNRANLGLRGRLIKYFGVFFGAFATVALVFGAVSDFFSFKMVENTLNEMKILRLNQDLSNAIQERDSLRAASARLNRQEQEYQTLRRNYLSAAASTSELSNRVSHLRGFLERSPPVFEQSAAQEIAEWTSTDCPSRFEEDELQDSLLALWWRLPELEVLVLSLGNKFEPDGMRYAEGFQIGPSSAPSLSGPNQHEWVGKWQLRGGILRLRELRGGDGGDTVEIDVSNKKQCSWTANRTRQGASDAGLAELIRRPGAR